jgi:hypothetical protein
MSRSSIRELAAVAVVLWATESWAQDNNTMEATLRLAFTRNGRPAAFQDVFVIPPGAAADAAVGAGTTGAEGRISLDTAIGGIPPGKPVKLTERTCKDGGAMIYLGDIPAKKDGCDDDVIGGLVWGPGSYTFKLDAGLLTPRNGAIAGGAAATVFIASMLAGNETAPAATVDPGASNATNQTSSPAVPSVVSFNGRYGGQFVLVTGNCGFFNPSFNGTLIATIREDGAADFEIVESITRRYVGRAQTTGPTTGTGNGTSGGMLPGNTAYNSVLNVAFSGDQATVEEILTLTRINCTATFRATATRQR